MVRRLSLALAGVTFFAAGYFDRQVIAIGTGLFFGFVAAADLVFGTYVRTHPPTIELKLPRERIALGDAASLYVRIANPSLVHLPDVRLTVEIPADIEVGRTRLPRTMGGDHAELPLMTSLPRRAGVEIKVQLRPCARGQYWIERTVAEVMAPLGTMLEPMRMGHDQRLIVYPRVLRIAPRLIGGREGGFFRQPALVDDPTLLKKLRDYRPGDPVSRMDWKNFAKTGSPVVREFETVRQPRVHLYLGLNPHPGHEVEHAYVEDAVTLCASLVWHLCLRHVPISVRSDGFVPGTDARAEIVLGEGAGLPFAEETLAVLAQIEPFGTFRQIGRQVADIVRSRDRGADSIVVITQNPEDVLSVAGDVALTIFSDKPSADARVRTLASAYA